MGKIIPLHKVQTTPEQVLMIVVGFLGSYLEIENLKLDRKEKFQEIQTTAIENKITSFDIMNIPECFKIYDKSDLLFYGLSSMHTLIIQSLQ